MALYANSHMSAREELLSEFSVGQKWLVGLTRNKKLTQYSCSVERSGQGPSYLFFQEFSMAITGAQLEEVDLESEHNKDLNPSEYLVDYENNKVLQVNGEFQSKLRKVEVFATSHSAEL